MGSQGQNQAHERVSRIKRHGGGRGGDLVRLRKDRAAFQPRALVVAALAACQARTVEGGSDTGLNVVVDWCSRLALDLDGEVCRGCFWLWLCHQRHH